MSEFASEPGCIVAENPDDFQSIAKEILEMEGMDVEIGPFTDKIRNWEKTGLEYLQVFEKQIMQSRKRDISG